MKRSLWYIRAAIDGDHSMDTKETQKLRYVVRSFKRCGTLTPHPSSFWQKNSATHYRLVQRVWLLVYKNNNKHPLFPTSARARGIASDATVHPHC